MNAEAGKFCPFINKDCVKEICMMYDAESTFGPLCSVKSTAKYMRVLAIGEDDLAADDFDDTEEMFEDLDDDDEASGDEPANPENN